MPEKDVWCLAGVKRQKWQTDWCLTPGCLAGVKLQKGASDWHLMPEKVAELALNARNGTQRAFKCQKGAGSRIP